MYFKVIKSGTNRKLVYYDFLLVVYSNFCHITHCFEKFDVKQSNDLEICPRSLTVVSPESCRVAMYVTCSEDSERMKRQSPFQLPHSHLTPPLQRTPTNICKNLILPEITFPGLHFCRCSSASFRTVLSESRRRQSISCRARNRF